MEGQEMKTLKTFLRDESGATAIEYGLIAALVAVAIIGALSFIGTELTETFTDVGTALDGAQGTASTGSTTVPTGSN
jgi:pilus assembly protein Flp/PilA